MGSEDLGSPRDWNWQFLRHGQERTDDRLLEKIIPATPRYWREGSDHITQGQLAERFSANLALLPTSSGARGTIVLVLVHFFKHKRWGSPSETDDAIQNLTIEDQLFILMQAGMYRRFWTLKY